MLSPVCSLVSIVPPFINDSAPPAERGRWLGLFFTAIPVGTAAGYSFSSAVASSRLTWGGAFLIEAAVAAPFVLLCFAIPPQELATSQSRQHRTSLSGLKYDLVMEEDFVHVSTRLPSDSAEAVSGKTRCC